MCRKSRAKSVETMCSSQNAFQSSPLAEIKSSIRTLLIWAITRHENSYSSTSPNSRWARGIRSTKLAKRATWKKGAVELNDYMEFNSNVFSYSTCYMNDSDTACVFGRKGAGREVRQLASGIHPTEAWGRRCGIHVSRADRFANAYPPHELDINGAVPCEKQPANRSRPLHPHAPHIPEVLRDMWIRHSCGDVLLEWGIK